MDLRQVQDGIIERTYAAGLLPREMDSRESRVALLTIGKQESRFEERIQVVKRQNGIRVANGPAHGFWQFEKGSASFGGGITGIVTHKATRYWLHRACLALNVPFEVEAIWQAIVTNDLLACVCARLLLFSDPYKLPALGDREGLWKLYKSRTWRPGKPRYDTWAENYRAALEAVTGNATVTA